MALITHATLETDLRLALTLDESLRITLTDMADIRSLPGAVLNLGSVNGSGSDTHQIRFASLGGANAFAGVGEDADVAATALTDASVSIAVTRHALVRTVSDLAIMTGFSDDIHPMRLAEDMALSYARRFNDLIATAVATATSNVGTSGVDMSVDDFYDAMFTLEQADNIGPYYAMLAPIQVTDLKESLRAEGGAVQWLAPTGEMLRLQGQGLLGEFLGIQIFKSSRITTAAGNREGAMWSAGALAYKTGQADARSFVGSAAIAVQQGEIVVEIAHEVGGGEVQIAGDAYVGVSVLEQARLVGIVTDA